jgi:GntP family gluconate:H+ symporter
MQNALSSAGIIILITASGGAFGKVLQQTGIGPEIQKLATAGQLAVLPLAFFVTALVRTAQGSATVAMITAVGILAGFADSATLGFHPVYLALAIGCGSKPFPWMNDSGFWIISRMSGFTEVETLKTFSVMLTSMGVVGLVVVMMLARLFPMI